VNFHNLFAKGPSVPEISHSDVPEDYQTSGVQYVDVRELNEWNEARMPGTVLIPLGSLAARVGELDKSRPVVTVCRSGARSINGGQILLSAGFTDVASLRGGLIAWSQAGRPLTR
jgi:rhodanese-related sulfurtransferase